MENNQTINTINDNVHGQIALTDIEKRIINSIPFNRLHDVYQDSLSYLSFPTNRTKRFEHSVGVMKICSDMVVTSLRNSSNDVLKSLITELKNGINSIEGSIISKEEKYEALCKNKKVAFDSKNAIFNDVLKICPIDFFNLENNNYLAFIIQVIRLAALLHDVGHPPFSHVVENALSAIKIKGNENGKCAKFHRIISSLNSEQTRKLHEATGDKIVDCLFRRMAEKDYSNADERYLVIILGVAVQCCYHNKWIFAFLHSYIDSSIDGDRLDFCVRDLANAGVGQGLISYPRIIDNIKICNCNDKEGDSSADFKIVFPVKCISTLEVFYKQYSLFYSDVISHHRTVKLEFMLEKSVEKLIVKYLESNDPEANDGSNVFDTIAGLWAPLDELWISTRMDAINQWNDSWLITLLKKNYFLLRDIDDQGKLNDKDKTLLIYLEELLRNTKTYYSWIKHRDNYFIFDNFVRKGFKDAIESFINDFENEHKNEKGKLPLPQVDAIKRMYSEDVVLASSFLGEYVGAMVEEKIKESQIDVCKIIRDTIIDLFKEDIEDAIVVRGLYKNGVKDGVLLYGSADEKYELGELSSIKKQIDTMLFSLPYVSIFVHYKNDDNNLKESKSIHKNLSRIGLAVGKTIAEHAKRYLRIVGGEPKCA